MNKRPIVAFCIPTYNRASFLKQSLESYVTNDGFDDDVEIVISDNASTDETQSIGEYYANHYPNIHYFRNDENIRDANFPLALDRATAHYVKLMNDNIPIASGGLKFVKEHVRKHLVEKPPLFFVSNAIKGYSKENEVVCNNFEDFVSLLSRNITGISLFGAWKEHWIKVIERNKYSKMQLSQDDWCYQIVSSNSKTVLVSGCYGLKKRDIAKRSGYNWFQVQIENYYKILQPYIDKGLVSNKALRKEKEKCLKMIMPWIAKRYWIPIYPEWAFDYKGTTRILWENFKSIPLFYVIMITLPIWANWHVLKYYTKCLLKSVGFVKR